MHRRRWPRHAKNACAFALSSLLLTACSFSTYVGVTRSESGHPAIISCWKSFEYVKFSDADTGRTVWAAEIRSDHRGIVSLTDQIEIGRLPPGPWHELTPYVREPIPTTWRIDLDAPDESPRAGRQETAWTIKDQLIEDNTIRIRNLKNPLDSHKFNSEEFEAKCDSLGKTSLFGGTLFDVPSGFIMFVLVGCFYIGGFALLEKFFKGIRNVWR